MKSARLRWSARRAIQRPAKIDSYQHDRDFEKLRIASPEARHHSTNSKGAQDKPDSKHNREVDRCQSNHVIFRPSVFVCQLILRALKLELPPADA